VPSPSVAAPAIRLGLRENWQQFSLLVLINAFVGGMVGLERTVVPLLAEQDFGLASRTIALSFIVSFGLVKALANLFAGRFSDRIGRKQILIAGWLFGLPVPVIIMLAPSWDWIVLANVLLGINQGLCWSTTIIMKIDLVGPQRRGLAMGLNEASGYLAVAAAALASGFLASRYGLRPEPFYLGIVFALAGSTPVTPVRPGVPWSCPPRSGTPRGGRSLAGDPLLSRNLYACQLAGSATLCHQPGRPGQ
jgi:MFS family permease